MNNASRIATLLFLHSRNEISREEEKELLDWRRQSADNEETFRDLSDAGYVRKMMAGFYKERDIVYNNLKRKIPDLSNSSLSTSPAYVTDPSIETFSEEYRLNFPEKQIAESGLTQAGYWESMLADIGGEENRRVTDRTGKPSLMKPAADPSSPHRKPIRYMRRFLRVAAAVVLLGVVISLFDTSSHKASSNRFEASFISSDGDIDGFLNDLKRGYYAGKAEIHFEQTPRGEDIYVFSNHSNLPKDYSYTLKTMNGKQFILRLPDGSQIWMNAESSINFPGNFSQDTINMSVGGEAYFEIASKSTHHYVIRSTVNGQRLTTNAQRLMPKELQIQANAGVFNISAYEENPASRVSMIQGSATIHMEGDGTTRPVDLQTGQQADLSNGKITVNTGFDNDEVLALKNGEIYLKSATLANILEVVARWYNVDVRYDLLPTDGRFTLKVPLGSDISVIVDSLKKQGVPILMTGKTISIAR